MMRQIKKISDFNLDRLLIEVQIESSNEFLL